MTLGHKVWCPDALFTLDLLGWKRSSNSCSAFTMQVGAGGALQHPHVLYPRWATVPLLRGYSNLAFSFTEHRRYTEGHHGENLRFGGRTTQT